MVLFVLWHLKQDFTEIFDSAAMTQQILENLHYCQQRVHYLHTVRPYLITHVYLRHFPLFFLLLRYLYFLSCREHKLPPRLQLWLYHFLIVICKSHEILFTKDVFISFDEYLKQLSQEIYHLHFNKFAEISELFTAVCLHYFVDYVAEEINKSRLEMGRNNHGLWEILVVVVS